MASNSVNIVFPGQFNPKTDRWCDYKEQLLCALDVVGACDIDRTKIHSIFLSQCGKDMYALIASLLVPQRPTSVDFEVIIGVLDKFYEPDANEILEAGKFHKRMQLPSESIQEFVAALGQHGAKCNFLDLKRQLRDRLVLGVRDNRLRRDLLKTKGLTYEQAVQMCLNYQASVLELYPDTSESKQNSPTGLVPMDIDKISSISCQRCGRTHSSGSHCPFLKAKCYFCKKFGHIAPVCKKKLSKLNQISDSEDRNLKSEENMMGIYTCTEKLVKPIIVDVLIEGMKLRMEVDSGASRSIISEEVYKNLWPLPPPLHSTNIKLVTWTRESLKVLGVACVRVRLGDKEGKCELIVVSGKGPSLLGRNWFDTLDIHIAGLCWSEEELTPYKDEFPDLFKEGLGTYRGPEVSLHIQKNVCPRFLKCRPVPFPLREQVNKELQSMISSGILTPVKYSKWATPLTIVKKADGSLRLCGDYRSTVNAAINVDSYPLPTSIEGFVKLSGGRIFSKLDLKQAYTQLKVDDDTANLLTLNTPLGLMKMNRLAFGVSAAPAIFQRLMSTALADMEGVACLLDDIAIMGRNRKEHDKRLRMVLQKLQDLGFRLNPEKCIFGTNSITFLGHVIDGEGLHPSPVKVKEIQDKTAPTNKETLRAFLGLYNFYEKFLPNKATILEPLYRLLDKKTPWVWTVKENEAFQKAKNLLSSDLTLVGYELDRELLLICDASEYGLGAIISHVMDDKSERPIMMASRTLQAHERRYGQIDKEALAIMYGVSKFHEFLCGRHFTIITDHKPLIGLFNPNKPIPAQISPRMLRWSLKLSCYNYSISYRPGKAIGNADALSRWNEPVEVDSYVDPVRDVLLLEEQPEGWNLDAKKIAVETKKDPLLQKVIFQVLHGWSRSNTDATIQPFWTRRDALSLDKDCLLWCNRVVIPTSLQKDVLKLLHAPHAGIVQTKAYARGYVWWVGMDKQIESTVAECQQCQLVRNNPSRESQAWIMPDKPWSRVHVDFAGPFQGKTFLVLIDSYSKWLEAEIMPSMSTTHIIQSLRRMFVSQGLPDTLVSDNGRSFTSEEFNEFLKKNGIKHLYSPPYHPATNGQIERAIQTFKNKVKKMSHVDTPWAEKLPKILYALRTVPNSCSNKTPAEMLNGRKYRTAISVLHPDNIQNPGERMLEEAAQRSSNRSFVVDQPVLVRNYGPGEKWQRAVIEMVEGPSAYLVRTEEGALLRRHVDQILFRGVRQTNTSSESLTRDQYRSRSSSPDPPVIIPPPEQWPDIIGIPTED